MVPEKKEVMTNLFALETNAVNWINPSFSRPGGMEEVLQVHAERGNKE